ncbi:MAG: hypothetical protein HZB29_10065 [Nitrospinae bacterium]|nr:hypothetical protein [Nitrospinota bacterium]
MKKDGRELSISANGWANGALRSTAKEPPVPPGGRIASRIAGLEDVTFNIEVDAELPQIEKFYSKAFADAGFSEKSSVKAEGLFHGHFSGPEGDAQIYAFTAGSSRKVTVVMPLAR